MLRSDQDNAILYLDHSPENKAYFLKLGEKVVNGLEACGFVKCPGEIMASNPKWCASMEDWENHFYNWVYTPEPQALMHASIFFDFRPVYGDFSLADALKTFVFDKMEAQSIFVTHFANNALLNPPPLSFFNNFIVEKGGDYSKQFDIKARAMMPLADAARVLTYDAKIMNYESTFDRFTTLGKQHSEWEKLFEDAATAYKKLMQIRGLEGLSNGNSGRFIQIENLNKLEKQTLKNIFGVISRVQKLLKTRFKTDYIRY